MSGLSDAVLMAVRPDFMTMSLGGISVLERQLYTLRKAGFSRAWISARRLDSRFLDSLRAPLGLEVVWSGDEGARACEPPYVSVSGDYLVTAEFLSSMRREARGAEAGFCYEDGTGTTVAQFFPKLPDLLHNTPRRVTAPMPEGACVPLELPPNDREAADWIFKTAARPDDGFMARHFDRKISLWITRRLAKLSVPPSLMTLVSGAVGLAGASLFLIPGRISAAQGALLIWAHSVLDGCDGELARVSLKESAFGRWLDYWGDNAVHVALFACLGLGLARQGRPWALELGASAAFATVVSALVVYGKRGRPGPARPAGALDRLRIYLEQRDFIYVLLVMAALGLSYEFLWLSAAGTALFLILLFVVSLAGGEEEES